MEKFKTEFKLKVYKSSMAGEGAAKLLARQLSAPEEQIRTWASHYRLHSHQDRDQLSSRQVAAVYDIRNPNQVLVWRRKLQEGGLPVLGNTKHGHPKIKPERRSPALPVAPTTTSASRTCAPNSRATCKAESKRSMTRTRIATATDGSRQR